MLVEAIQAYLTADTGLQTLVGTALTRTDKTTGFFPTQGPDEVPPPWVVYQQVSGQPLGSPLYTGTGRLTTERWRFTCYGSTYKQAKQVAKAVKSAMLSLLGQTTTGNAYVEGCWPQLEIDEAEPLPRGTVYATHLDFEIIYRDGD